MDVERPVDGLLVPDNGHEDPPEDKSLAALAELRTLLFGEDQRELHRIKQRLEIPELHSADISRILPEAIALRSKPDLKLAEALAPTFQESFKISVKRIPQVLVDAISPVMGPAIRKSISDALQRMVQSLNQTLEYGFSSKGLKWRLEAFRTGKPFAEVILLHTLLFRVEQVFLIHRKNGLLLQHATAGLGSTQDADMVSGMLSAIQDFVRDSFGGKEEESLDQAQVGELTIWIERGPQIILAAVIRGNAPQSLRSTLQETAEKIQIESRKQLDDFEGDAAPFESVRSHLEACLLQAGRDEPAGGQKPAKKQSPAIKIIGAALILGIGAWVFFTVRDNLRWSRYLERLSAEPGFVVTGSGKRNGHRFVEGLRDPLAADPNRLARETANDPAKILSRWEPYNSFDGSFAIQRARAALTPPSSVSLRLDDGVLRAQGAAAGSWIADARKIAPLVPGISRFDDAQLTQSDRPDSPDVALQAARGTLKPPPGVAISYSEGVLYASGAASHAWIADARSKASAIPGVKAYDDVHIIDIDHRNWVAESDRLESITIDFPAFGTDMLPGQQGLPARAAEAIGKLSRMSAENKTPFRINIVGHSAASHRLPGLSRQRADRIRNDLISMGIAPDIMIAQGLNDGPTGLTGGHVSFQVVVGAPTGAKAHP